MKINADKLADLIKKTIGSISDRSKEKERSLIGISKDGEIFSGDGERFISLHALDGISDSFEAFVDSNTLHRAVMSNSGNDVDLIDGQSSLILLGFSKWTIPKSTIRPIGLDAIFDGEKASFSLSPQFVTEATEFSKHFTNKSRGPVFSGVWIDVSDGLCKISGSDGISGICFYTDCPGKAQLVLPKKSVAGILNIVSDPHIDMEVNAGYNIVEFVSDGNRFKTTLLNCVPPDIFSLVMDKYSSGVRIKFDTRCLLNTLKHISETQKEFDFNPIHMLIRDNKLSLIMNSHIGTVLTVDCEGPDFFTAFDCNLLYKRLSNIPHNESPELVLNGDGSIIVSGAKTSYKFVCAIMNVETRMSIESAISKIGG
jgi:hypothetical protein